MQSRLAYKLLFDEKAPDGATLFPSVSGLAEVISSFRNDEKARTLSSFLSQILNLAQRSCPPQLMEDIERAVEQRLQGLPEEDRSAWSARTRRALQTDNLSRKSGEPLSAEVLFGELLYLAETSAEQYIITAVTAEEALSKRAEPLREALLRRLLILEADPSKVPTTKYTFCLPTDDDCFRWWNALTRETKAAAKHRDIQLDQEHLDAYFAFLEESDFLRVFVVPPILCGCPVVIFNPLEPNLAGFNLYYFSDPNRDEYLVSVAKMDPLYLSKWKPLVYDPLERSQRTRIKYNQSAETTLRTL